MVRLKRVRPFVDVTSSSSGKYQSTSLLPRVLGPDEGQGARTLPGFPSSKALDPKASITAEA
jgi:hypothetical protein